VANFHYIVKKEPTPNLQTLKDDIDSRRDNEYFRPNGTQIYVGRQGQGKTISAVYHMRKLKKRYPKAIVVSNLDLTEYQPVSHKYVLEFGIDPQKQYVYFQTQEELHLVLVGINNDKYGVIYLIDEIHTYFNSLESKNTPMFVFTEISQQRKQRKLIIGTSQLFERSSKPLREQVDNVIICRTRFGVFTTHTVYDGVTLEQDYNGKYVGEKRRFGFFIQDRKTRNAYDTFQKVVSGVDQLSEIQKPLSIEITGKLKKKITLK